MSRIPNSAMPHAWAEDSEHAEQARRARGMTGKGRGGLKLAALAGFAVLGFGLLFARRRHA